MNDRSLYADVRCSRFTARGLRIHTGDPCASVVAHRQQGRGRPAVGVGLDAPASDACHATAQGRP